MIEFKKDPFVAIIWVIVLLGVGFFFYKGKISWEIGLAFLGTLGLPSLLGRKKEDKK